MSVLVPVPVPHLNANDDAVLVVRWHADEGAEVAAGAPLVDVETTKSVATVDAPASGRLRRRVAEGIELPVGAELAVIESTGTEAAPASGPDARATPPAARVSGGGGADDNKRHEVLPGAGPALALPDGAEPCPVRLSREAARVVAERGLDPAKPFPGASGLVTAARLSEALLRGETQSGRSSHPPGAGDLVELAKTRPAGGASPARRERVAADKRAEIAALRQGAGDGLRSSLTTYFDSEPIRAALGEGRGLLAYVLAEVARLVAARPLFAAWHEGGATVYHDAVHLGVAVDLGDGLRVVTLRDADRADAAELEARLAERVLDCAERRLAPGDAEGSTFTVTDLSALDVLHFEPLINGRQSAILGVGGDASLPGWPVSLTMAFDHRVLNGRQAAEFLRELRSRLEALATRGEIVPDGAVADAGAGDDAQSGAGGGGSRAKISPSCDRCAVEAADYYARFGRAAILHNYTRADGTAGCICHACLALG